MSPPEIDTKVFLKYLKHLGLEEMRSKGSHHAYNYPKVDSRRLRRPVIVQAAKKTIPRFIIAKNLETIGISMSNFEAWLAGPQKAKKSQYKAQSMDISNLSTTIPLSSESSMVDPIIQPDLPLSQED